MVQGPDLDTFVVCRANEDVGLLQIGEVSESSGSLLCLCLVSSGTMFRLEGGGGEWLLIVYVHSPHFSTI